VTEFSENNLTFTESRLSISEHDDGIALKLLTKGSRKQPMIVVESAKDPGVCKMELILEKITIPPPLACVFRPRLQSLLEQSLASCTCTILSGRAGTGKTMLALDFADRCGREVAWYKVDAPDSELRIFFRYLIESIDEHRRGFGDAALVPLLGNSEVLMPSLAEAFVYELERTPGPALLVVIEDLHLVCDSQWLVPFFTRLLPLLPSDVHMLITSRTMPPAPLWRMRSKQTLSVIDEETLSFNKQEAVDLFQSLNLTQQQASIAWHHSHGKAAALATLAATLHYSENQSVDSVIQANDRAEVI
jgi:ATP/maltotriose-dependent transcriptional regulator MalT